jgi:5-(carboxyamino)imidazole ribonucleotide mutase
MSAPSVGDGDAARGSGPPLVAVAMGSPSDLKVMQPAVDALAELGIAHEVRIVSAHRTPDHMVAFAHGAAARGIRVLVAGAGGAAHLPGMLAALCTLPVIGVPVPLAHLDGLDSLLSMVQMPAGVPVATVAVGGARNAGLLAARILALGDPALAAAVADLAAAAAARSLAADAELLGRATPPGPEEGGDAPPFPPPPAR